MRLTPEQREAIRETAAEVFGPSATVRLFGSRIDDEKKGGDIDLLINADLTYRAAIDAKIRFLANLTRRIGERRVDVVLVTPDSPPRDIVAVAEEQGVAI